MGQKITVDSATMMNKGLEVIEARWEFDMDPSAIEVVIHPQSVVHSMVRYQDGAIIAQLGIADMRIPIAYALSFPNRLKGSWRPLDLTQHGELNFLPVEKKRFPALSLAYDALREGGTMPAVLNGANEVAVAAFLERQDRISRNTSYNCQDDAQTRQPGCARKSARSWKSTGGRGKKHRRLFIKLSAEGDKWMENLIYSIVAAVIGLGVSDRVSRVRPFSAGQAIRCRSADFFRRFRSEDLGKKKWARPNMR